MSKWFRVAHLEYQPFVKVGEYVTPKTVIGKVGSTGRSTGPHVHLDGTLGRPKSWYQYTARPIKEFFDTEAWAPNVLPYPKMYLTNRHGVNRHYGVDVNVAPEDSGLLVYSPCYGRVQYVEPAVSVYRVINGIRKLFQPTWGGGFGNFLWIECDETRPAV